MFDKNCIFCRIAAGEINAAKIYEDEHCVAFRDINPQAPVHLLLVPRTHITSVDEHSKLEAESLAALLRASAHIAQQEGIKESGYRIVINSGADAGQTVFHLHLHILGGRTMNWPPG